MNDLKARGPIARARSRALMGGWNMLYRLRGRPTTRHILVGAPQMWAMQRRFQFKFLISQGLQPHHRLLDVGCGTLRGGIPFIDYLEPGNYTGIDARPKALEEARKELADAKLEHKHPVLVLAAHPAEIHLDVSFDFACAFWVLIHMTDDIVQAYLAFVRQVLGRDGVFYANVILGNGPEKEWSGFPVVERPREVYREWAATAGLEVSDVGKLSSLGHHAGIAGDDMMMLRFTLASPRPSGTRTSDGT
jgi:SAM-dependent methyltransferase